MNPFFLRLFAGFLIPCLLLDPAWSQVSFAPSSVHPAKLMFTHQAVVARLGSARRELNRYSESTVRLRQWAGDFFLNEDGSVDIPEPFNPWTEIPPGFFERRSVAEVSAVRNVVAWIVMAHLKKDPSAERVFFTRDEIKTGLKFAGYKWPPSRRLNNSEGVRLTAALSVFHDGLGLLGSGRVSAAAVATNYQWTRSHIKPLEVELDLLFKATKKIRKPHPRPHDVTELETAVARIVEATSARPVDIFIPAIQDHLARMGRTISDQEIRDQLKTFTINRRRVARGYIHDSRKWTTAGRGNPHFIWVENLDDVKPHVPFPASWSGFTLTGVLLSILSLSAVFTGFHAQMRGIVPDWVLGYTLVLAGAILVGIYVFHAMSIWLDARIKRGAQDVMKDLRPVERLSEKELNEQLMELEELLIDILPAWRWPQTLRNLETLMEVNGYQIAPKVKRLKDLKERDWGAAERWSYYEWEMFVGQVVRDLVNPKLENMNAPGLVLDEGIIRIKTPGETLASKRSADKHTLRVDPVPVFLALAVALDPSWFILSGVLVLRRILRAEAELYPFHQLKKTDPPLHRDGTVYKTVEYSKGGVAQIALPDDFQDGTPIVVVFPGKLLELWYSLKNKVSRRLVHKFDVHHWLPGGLIPHLQEMKDPARVGVVLVTSRDAQNWKQQVRLSKEEHTDRASEIVDGLLAMYPKSRLVFVGNSYGARVALEDLALHQRSTDQVAATVVLNAAMVLDWKMKWVERIERPVFFLLGGWKAGRFIQGFKRQDALDLQRRLNRVRNLGPVIFISTRKDGVVDSAGARGLYGPKGSISYIIDDLGHEKSWRVPAVFKAIAAVVKTVTLGKDARQFVLHMNGNGHTNGHGRTLGSFTAYKPLEGFRPMDYFELRPPEPPGPSLQENLDHFFHLTGPTFLASVRHLWRAFHGDSGTNTPRLPGAYLALYLAAVRPDSVPWVLLAGAIFFAGALARVYGPTRGSSAALLQAA